LPCETVTFKYIKDIDKAALYVNDGFKLKEFIEIDGINELIRNWIDEQRSR
jgi:hypothetical protein